MEGWDGDTWQGSPLDMRGMDPYGIYEVVVEFDNGDTDTFQPLRRREFGSYELNQMGTYLDTLAAAARRGQRR